MIPKTTPFEELTEGLSAEEVEALERVIDTTREKMLDRGARFDFFGGATLDLDSIFVDPRRESHALAYLAGDAAD